MTEVLSQTVTRPAPFGQDTLTLTSANALRNALENTLVVRADKVAQARRDELDPSYPSPVMIRKF